MGEDHQIAGLQVAQLLEHLQRITTDLAGRLVFITVKEDRSDTTIEGRSVEGLLVTGEGEDWQA